jgi:hypothetical protein
MYARTINSYLSWLHEEGHLAEHLRIKLLPNHPKPLKTFSDVDIRKILNFKPNGRIQTRTWTLVVLLFDTGIRFNPIGNNLTAGCRCLCLKAEPSGHVHIVSDTARHRLHSINATASSVVCDSHKWQAGELVSQRFTIVNPSRILSSQYCARSVQRGFGLISRSNWNRGWPDKFHQFFIRGSRTLYEEPRGSSDAVSCRCNPTPTASLCQSVNHPQ